MRACHARSHDKRVAKPRKGAYYSSPRNTNRAANAAATRVAGLMGGRAEQFCSADRSEKNFADLLTKRRLFFIISFLCCDANDAADKQYRPRQSRCGQFFNNQTTDKCGRLMANAARTPVCVLLQKLSSARTVKHVRFVLRSGSSQFSESERPLERARCFGTTQVLN